MAHLVTGATGLIGSRVVNELATAGKSVIGYSRNPDQETVALVISKEAQQHVRWVRGDILDFDCLVNTITGHGVDAVIHCAATLGDEIKANPRLATRINCEGTVNVFEAARSLSLRKVVYASSNGAFPSRLPTKPQEEWTIDDYVLYPWGLYGAAKQYCEHAAEYYYRNWGTDITGVRIASICYGVGHKHGKTADLMRELLLKPAVGEPAFVDYDIDSVDNFLHADDAAHAAVLCLNAKREADRGIVYNVKGPLASVREIYGYVRELLPDADITFTGDHSNEVNKSSNTEATERDLGFCPRYSVKEGVKQTINRMREFHGLPLL